MPPLLHAYPPPPPSPHTHTPNPRRLVMGWAGFYFICLIIDGLVDLQTSSVVLPPNAPHTLGLLDDEAEGALLDEFPMGDFLLHSRTLWMVGGGDGGLTLRWNPAIGRGEGGRGITASTDVRGIRQALGGCIGLPPVGVAAQKLPYVTVCRSGTLCNASAHALHVCFRAPGALRPRTSTRMYGNYRNTRCLTSKLARPFPPAWLSQRTVLSPLTTHPTQLPPQVRFITDRKGRVLRESVHRPSEGSPGRPLLVSTYTLEGELVRRAKQYVSPRVHQECGRKKCPPWQHLWPLPPHTRASARAPAHTPGPARGLRYSRCVALPRPT